MKYTIDGESDGDQVSCTKLLDCAKISDKDGSLSEAIQEISLQIIIEIYCTVGENFSAKYFKQIMTELGLPTLCIIKLFSMLEGWRKGTIPMWVIEV